MSNEEEMIDQLEADAREHHVIRLAARLMVAAWGSPGVSTDATSTEQLAASVARASFKAAEMFMLECERRSK